MKKINLIIIFMFIFSLMLNANVIEDEILRLINLERSKSSLPPIPNNERLHSIALYHSDNMANNKFFGNTDLDGLDSKGRQIKLYPEMVGTITYANIIAEEVDFKTEAKFGDDITIKYRILNKAPFTDFKIAVEMADKNAKVIGDDGKTYIGVIIYDVKDAGNNVLSRTFKAEYGKGDYKISLLYKGERYQSNIRTITVK